MIRIGVYVPLVGNSAVVQVKDQGFDEAFADTATSFFTPPIVADIRTTSVSGSLMVPDIVNILDPDFKLIVLSPACVTDITGLLLGTVVPRTYQKPSEYIPSSGYVPCAALMLDCTIEPFCFGGLVVRRYTSYDEPTSVKSYGTLCSNRIGV
ncbi:hypothetical protein D3C74_218290 [compost metagenome]